MGRHKQSIRGRDHVHRDTWPDSFESGDRPGLYTVTLPLEALKAIISTAVNHKLYRKSMYGTRDAASKWKCDWQEHIKSWEYQLGLSSKNLLRHDEHRVSGLTQGEDFVVTGSTDRLTEFENKMTGACPTKTNSSQLGQQKASTH